jgi:hypothetical protein
MSHPKTHPCLKQTRKDGAPSASLYSLGTSKSGILPACRHAHKQQRKSSGPPACRKDLMLWYLFLTFLVGVVCMGLFVKGLRRWFLAFGCLGVLIALTLTAISTRHVIKPRILLVLWPPALAGLANPSTLSDKIIVAAFEFGGNFILYGAMGVLIGLCLPKKACGPYESPHPHGQDR